MRGHASSDLDSSGTLDVVAIEVKLAPELQPVVERARTLARERGELLDGPSNMSLTALSDAARLALADWVSSGDYDRAVAEISADDPDLATQ